MKRKLLFIIWIFAILTLAFQSSPYARRIRPFASTPVSCQENEIGYNMTSHALVICTNVGFQVLSTGASGSFAPSNATFITQTTNATLTNEQALSALATGILKNTTATGILSIGVAGDVNSILPTQASHSGEFLTTNGTISSWSVVSAGITNSAPANTIPLSNGTNLIDSNITWDGSTLFSFNVAANGNVTLQTAGLGAQLFIKAADGDETHVGGEVTITSGGATDQNGGDIIIATGPSQTSDSGGLTLKTGSATNGADGGGDAGDIILQAGSGTIADSSGGGINITAGAGRTGGGNVNISAGARTVSGSNGVVGLFSADSSTFQEINNLGIFLISGGTLSLDVPKIAINATITASGTTGAQTINKPGGSVNFATSETSLVVTNSTVTTDSIINCTVATNDTTLKSVQCVAGSGSFTMFANAAATAETRVNFEVKTPQ